MSWWFLKKKKVGLALGGGVARGIAHVGALKVLQAYKVPIDFIVGTSSGSLVGAAFASGMDVSLIEQVALHIHWADLFKLAFFRPGFVSEEAIEDFVNKYIGDLNIRELKVPFAAVATDIRTGEEVVISEGKLARAVAASSAFPGFFSPADMEGRFLIDGGLASNVPVDVARRMGAEFVIASNVIPTKYVRSLPRDPLQAFGRSLDLLLNRLSRDETSRADILVQLELEEDIWHLDLNKAKKLISAGEIAAHRMINKIRKTLRLRS